MKFCTKCNREKSLDKFSFNRATKDGRGSWCKDCHNNYASTYDRYKYRVKVIKDRQPEGWKRCNKCLQPLKIEEYFYYRKDDLGRFYFVSSCCHFCAKENRRIRGRNIKIETLNAYGGCICCWCGEDNIDSLTLDHKFNDGINDREEMGVGLNFYISLKKKHYPNKDKYQVLCYCCNCSKSTNGGKLLEVRKDINRNRWTYENALNALCLGI